MTPTRFLALDIGNVLCVVNTDPFIRTLSDKLKISTDQAISFTKRGQKAYDLGLTTMVEELKENFGGLPDDTINQIVESWCNIVTPHLPTLDMLNDIKSKYWVNVALLSNIGIEHAEIIDRKLDHNDFLSNTIRHFSCEVGARKPSLLYYQSFLMQNPEAQGCMYVDDLIENIQAAHKMGFKVIHFDLSKPNVEANLLYLCSQIEQYCYGYHK